MKYLEAKCIAEKRQSELGSDTKLFKRGEESIFASDAIMKSVINLYFNSHHDHYSLVSLPEVK